MNCRKDILALRVAALLGGLFFIVLSTSCGRRFPDPSQQGEFERIVLLEEGTGTWCTYCPEAAENIETLLGAHPGEFIVLGLHKQDEYSSDDTEARLANLGVGAYPTIIFDGVEESGRGVDEMGVILEDRRALGSPIKLELTASLTEDSVLYEITAIVSEKIAENIEGTLRIALVEDTITDASVGLQHHVVRRLPEATGDDALTLEPGDTVDLYRALPLDQSWGRPLNAVVWIEASDLNVYQSASYELGGGPSQGEFSIEVEGDTIQTDTLGGEGVYYFTLHNHTNNALTLTVDLPADSLELPAGWSASICDEGSCYPIPFDVEVPANGTSQEFHLTITSSTEGAEGKVVMTVTGGGGGGEEVDRQTFILQIQG
jgi:hypothetical protein